jgi:Glyoxalase-like domain
MTLDDTHAARTAPASQLDHLVVLAHSLDEGISWCDSRFGIRPGPGGEHPLMGTHNRLFSIASTGFANAYLEIIAVNPDAKNAQRTGTKRWFDIDDEALRERVRRDGPQFIHWVARVADVGAAVATLGHLGIDRGEVLAASRATATGLLQWQITVRADGQRLFDGGLPTLIQWAAVHPATAFAASGVSLQGLTLRHPQADLLRTACGALGLAAVAVVDGPARLSATFETPRGLVEIHS